MFERSSLWNVPKREGNTFRNPRRANFTCWHRKIGRKKPMLVVEGLWKVIRYLPKTWISWRWLFTDCTMVSHFCLSMLSTSKKMVAFSLFGPIFFGAECISSTLGWLVFDQTSNKPIFFFVWHLRLINTPPLKSQLVPWKTSNAIKCSMNTFPFWAPRYPFLFSGNYVRVTGSSSMWAIPIPALGDCQTCWWFF